jgi:threonine aldolase
MPGPSGVVDLRSDTVTTPTPDMRRAMAEAEVGDDGFGEDPTVRRLEEQFAACVGKDAAVYVPSGTMGNQIALRLLGQRGSAVVVGRRQHVVAFERGAAAANGWAQLLTVDDEDGTIDPAALVDAVEAGGPHHWLPVSAVSVENTHMPACGAPWPIDRLRAVAAVGVPMHLDGARLWNASVATGIPMSEYAAPATTVMCCLSKGLAAPVGSLLAVPADREEEARIERKRLGGGMRQAGVIAAAGLVALESMVERLAEDHARARRLAAAVAERWPDALDPDTVQTNLVVFPHANTDALLDHFATEGVLATTIAPRVVRLCLHKDIDDEGVERAAKAVAGAP